MHMQYAVCMFAVCGQVVERVNQMRMQYARLQCVHVYGHLESFCILADVQCEGCGVTCSHVAMPCSVWCICAVCGLNNSNIMCTKGSKTHACCENECSVCGFHLLIVL